MFYAVPISAAFIAEIEAVSRTRIVEQCLSIDEKHSVVDIVFLAYPGEDRVSKTFVLIVSRFV